MCPSSQSQLEGYIFSRNRPVVVGISKYIHHFFIILYSLDITQMPSYNYRTVFTVCAVFSIHAKNRGQIDMEQAKNEADTSEILPVSVPVEMPALPPTLVIRTIQQFKAISDPVRSRILKLIQYQPATAKQIAERFHIPHGTVGHHLQVLEAAGLAQVVARRLVRGIVAKYYSRTARIFVF